MGVEFRQTGLLSMGICRNEENRRWMDGVSVRRYMASLSESNFAIVPGCVNGYTVWMKTDDGDVVEDGGRWGAMERRKRRMQNIIR